MTGEPDTRDSLIRKALRGDISPDDAEAEAKRLGLGPLAANQTNLILIL
jgi:hypothetical protein